MQTLEIISDETIEAIKKAQTSGVTTSTGIFGVDLSGVVSLVPVNTPLYDRVPRRGGDGATAASWRVLLNVNNAQPNPFVGLDAGGNFVQLSELDCLAPYRPVRVSGRVTRDAVALGKGYADAKAIASTNTLMQWRILDNKALIGGQAFALPTIGSLTVATSTTGGSLPATTQYWLKCAARSPYNYYWGGSGIASSAGTVTTGAGSTNKITATVPAVRGAVAYDWYFSSNNATYYYLTTTVVNAVTVTAAIAADQALPNIPGLYATAPSGAAVPASDTSYSTNSYNGLIAGLSGSYLNNGQGLVTFGTGSSTPSGALITSLDGAAFTANSQGIKELDTMLLNIFNAVQLSPTMMVMNAQQANDIAVAVLGTNSAVTYLTPTDPARRGFDAGATVSGYISRAAGGQRVEIVVDPWWPVGTIGFYTERVPFPNSNISNALEARTLFDVTETPYGTSLTPGGAGSGPRDEWDTSSMETCINRAPTCCGLLTNILSS